MKKITVTASLIAVLMFITIMQAAAQIYYEPNEKASTIWREYGRVKNIEKKEIKKAEKKLLKAIDIDSNFAHPYACIGLIKLKENQFLTKDGAFYYFAKYFEKIKKYPTKNFDIKCYNQGSTRLVGDCGAYIKLERAECLIAAYRLQPELFNPKSDTKNHYSINDLSNLINLCISDFESVRPLIDYYDGRESLINHLVFDLYSLKGEFDFIRGDYASSSQCYKLLIDQLKKDYDKKLLVYDKLYNMFIEIKDKQSASKALMEYLETYRIKIFGERGLQRIYYPNGVTTSNPCYGKKNSSIEFLTKRKQLIALMNENYNLKPNDYEICNINGTAVFCENQNIAISNFSSAHQFWTIYNSNGLLNQYFDENEMTLINRDGFDYSITDELYDFYLKIGKEQGLIWPKFKLIQLVKENVRGTFLNDFFSCGNFTRIYDMKNSQVFCQAKIDSTLTLVFDISNDWRTFNQIPVTFYNSQKQIVTQTSKGVALPKTYNCEKLYLIEKQKYENQQALLMAQQQQQLQEVQRLQQEQNYKETQLRLIEEENVRKQKEIDLVNSKNQQIEKQKELENQKAAKEFMKFMFQSSGSSSGSSSSGSSNSEPTRKCTWCGNTFSKPSYSFYKNYSGSCDIKEYNYNPQAGSYCSQKCANQACSAKD